MDSTQMYVGCIPNILSLLESFSHFKHRKMMSHKNFVVYLTLITIALTIYTKSSVYANSTNVNSTREDFEDYQYADNDSDLTETQSWIWNQ